MPRDSLTVLAEDERLTQWRDDTPSCADRVHLNNAGASLMPVPVQEAVWGHIELEAVVGGYEAEDLAAESITSTYRAIADLLGCKPSNVAVVENATVAVAQALSAFDFEPGDRVVTTNADYGSNQLMLLSLARRRGIELRRAVDLPEGGVDPDSVRALVRDGRCRLVVVTWVPTNSGLVQDVEAVGKVCAEHDVPYLVDACQTVGQLPVDVRGLRCDFLAATARKFLRGPRGIGFLYVSDRALQEGRSPLFPDIRGALWPEADQFQVRPDARRFENWEFAYALVLGLGAAARYAAEVGVEEAGERARALAACARERLADLDGVRVLDRGRALCAITTVAVEGWDARQLVLELRKRGINTSASLREYSVIDMDAKRATSALRVSPHYYNTVEEVDGLVAALGGLVAEV